MNSLLGRAVPVVSATLTALALIAAPVAAQGHGRGVPPGIARNGNCPPGLAKQGRCGYSADQRNGDWCLDRNRDGRCDAVYDNRSRRNDEVYGRNDNDDDDVYRSDSRNGGYIYGRDGQVYDRNGNIVYDRNGRVTQRDRGKQAIRDHIGDIANRARRNDSRRYR